MAFWKVETATSTGMVVYSLCVENCRLTPFVGPIGLLDGRQACRPIIMTVRRQLSRLPKPLQQSLRSNSKLNKQAAILRTSSIDSTHYLVSCVAKILGLSPYISVN